MGLETAEVRGGWSHHVWSQEAGRDESWGSAGFVLFISLGSSNRNGAVHIWLHIPYWLHLSGNAFMKDRKGVS